MKSDRSRGGTSSQNSRLPGRTNEEDKRAKYLFSDNKLPKSKQEEIITLFRRIKSSISKSEATSAQKTNIDLSDQKFSTKPVGEAIHRSKRRVKGNRQDTTQTSRWHRALTSEEAVAKNDNKLLNDAQILATRFNTSRPASKFVRRSPIPFPSIPIGNSSKQNSDTSAATKNDEALKLLQIEEMKLPQLKQLAKSRGVKGYSKLKKGELLKLLRS